MKEIQEFWAELVTAGLLPFANCENATAKYHGCAWRIRLSNDIHIYDMNIFDLKSTNNYEPIQLRSNGIDLVKLEWQKPTEQDVGKMCWFWDFEIGLIVHGELCLNKDMDYDGQFAVKLNNEYEPYEYCLVATHGRLAPEPKNFEEAYK